MKLTTIAVSTVVTPSRDYIAFENNAASVTFGCLGNGTTLYWTVDGYTTGESYVLSRGIHDSRYLVTPDGLRVYSSLTVPTSHANSNISVICTTFDPSIMNKRESSDPVKLMLQGTVMRCLSNQNKELRPTK